MKRFKGRVRVMPRAGLLDPQGSAIEHALGALNFGGVDTVRVGRTLEMVIDGDSDADVRDKIRSMCEKLLANPVTEDFTIDAVEAVS